MLLRADAVVLGRWVPSMFCRLPWHELQRKRSAFKVFWAKNYSLRSLPFFFLYSMQQRENPPRAIGEVSKSTDVGIVPSHPSANSLLIKVQITRLP